MKLMVCLVGLLVAAQAVAAGARAHPAECIDPKSALIASGPSPTGEQFTIRAEVRNNGSDCHAWLFQVKFRLPRVMSWSGATGIPLGGHLSRYFTISALDGESPDNTERVFSGFTGREAAKLLATLEDGTRLEIKLRFPSPKLRRQSVWMRGFRYFAFYYGAGSGVESISLFTKGGRLLYRERSEDGVF